VTDGPTKPPPPPQAFASDAFDRFQPVIAIGAMVATFLLMPQAFAVSIIALVWVIATRVTRDRRFLGLSLTEALAWAATLVIVFLCLAIVLYALVPPAAR
jgi:hypothetical protein